ncbi:hypothetical protein ONZ45_g3388 [Pleurotus djamor]|nr:hypothetical protein ONZ45_g3388 [Pleurotus djamor]
MAKTEETPSTPASSSTPAPATQTPQPTQPVMSYSPAQWPATSHIPIDPALQAQSSHATTTPYTHYQNYYPQAQYSHYQYAAATATPATATTTTGTASQPKASGASGADSDIATLNDALGSAGVDLRAEEETLQRSHDQHQSYRTYEDRTRKQPPTPNFNTQFLNQSMRVFATPHKVTKIPEDSINYLALALRTRLQDLITAMIDASDHRTDTHFERPASLYEDGTPMWSLVVRNDVAKQLAALEKVEREEEMKTRRERKERADLAAAQAAQLAAQAPGGSNAMAVDSPDDESGGQKKKKKKDGPGVTARNMSEDVRKKMSNAVASQAAGLGGKYAWMTAASSSPAKPKTATPASTSTASASTSTSATTTVPATGTSGGSWARPYVSTKKSTSNTTPTPTEEDTRTTVTLRDAMFVVEKERGHGGGRGAARIYV